MKVFEVTKTPTQVKNDIDSMFRDYMDNAVKNNISVSDKKQQQVKIKIRQKVLSQQATSDKLSKLSAPSVDDQRRINKHLAHLSNAMPDEDTVSPTRGRVTPVPVSPSTLPAIISKDLQAAGTRDVEFIQVKNLPGMMKQGIRQLGKQVFGTFTNTPIDDIAVIANLKGMGGPNDISEINAVAGYAKKHGVLNTRAQLDFDKVMPEYEADVVIYNTTDVTYMLVKDFMGRYIYSWPTSQSARITTNSPKRIHEGMDTHCKRHIMQGLYRISTIMNHTIAEMSDDDIMGDVGEKPIRKLSPAMELRKQQDQEKIRIERDWDRHHKRRNRLRGNTNRGTEQYDHSVVQK